ncbi:MAG: hypothetical protein R3F49_10180 [Planctomycetota bacterium]
MQTTLLRLVTLATLLVPAAAQDWVIPAGTTVSYDTSATVRPLRFASVIIEADARLVVRGDNPLSIICAELVVDGVLDVSGDASSGVLTLNTTNQPEPGAAGGPGGGAGGTGSANTSAQTPMGLPGLTFEGLGSGGDGGESAFALGAANARRAAGGGGGRLAADVLLHPNPLDPSNLGLVATGGFSGNMQGLGALSQSQAAQGGAAGAAFFSDGDATNDFWGRRATLFGVQQGEAPRPTGGRGGGAGGDASRSGIYPSPTFLVGGDEKGAGGGGGGGLLLVNARRISIGAGGQILANGGDGGGGENTLFFDRIGGGSGAGSGGWIILQAVEFDLSRAGADALQALGGRGGRGAQNVYDVEGAGGNGGPGVIQLHTPTGTLSGTHLPSGASLDDLCAPDAYVLLPALR